MQKSGKIHGGLSLLIMTALFCVVLVMMSRNVQKELTDIVDTQDKPMAAPKHVQGKSPKTAKRVPKTITQGIAIYQQENSFADEHRQARVTRIVIGQEFILHKFYIDSEQVAMMQEYANGDRKLEGTLPEGKVHFKDHSKHSEGEEFYRNGTKHGKAMAYYSDGIVKLEENYAFGKLLTVKEYYQNGKLRLDADYSNARQQKDVKELGVGKLYFPNGYLKYEWKFTVGNNTGFQKSYNQDGTLRHEAYYDKQGNLIVL